MQIRRCARDDNTHMTIADDVYETCEAKTLEAESGFFI
jgi:hypothetical protein